MKKRDFVVLSSSVAKELGLHGNELLLYHLLALNAEEGSDEISVEEIESWCGDEALTIFSRFGESGIVKTLEYDGKKVVYRIEKKAEEPVHIYNNCKKKKGIFESNLQEMGVSEDLISDYMIVRKQKRGVDTATAWKRMKSQIDLAVRIYNITPEDCIRIAVERNWLGFDAEWLARIKFDSKDTQADSITLKDGTKITDGKRFYTSMKDNRQHECPLNAALRPSAYFDFNYSRNSWEVVNG